MSEHSLGDAMKDFLQKSRLKSGINAIRIEQLWEEMMGKTIAKYTDKIELVGKTLFILTAVGPLKQELMYQKDKIMERVNEAMGEQVVDKVVIK